MQLLAAGLPPRRLLLPGLRLILQPLLLLAYAAACCLQHAARKHLLQVGVITLAN
jgi:hypothetical protein